MSQSSYVIIHFLYTKQMFMLSCLFLNESFKWTNRSCSLLTDSFSCLLRLSLVSANSIPVWAVKEHLDLPKELAHFTERVGVLNDSFTKDSFKTLIWSGTKQDISFVNEGLLAVWWARAFHFVNSFGMWVNLVHNKERKGAEELWLCKHVSTDIQNKMTSRR